MGARDGCRGAVGRQRLEVMVERGALDSCRGAVGHQCLEVMVEGGRYPYAERVLVGGAGREWMRHQPDSGTLALDCAWRCRITPLQWGSGCWCGK